MVPLLVQFIVALIVAGFLFWALQMLLPHVPLPAEFHGFINVAMKIVIVAVLIFYFIIPLLKIAPTYIHL